MTKPAPAPVIHSMATRRGRERAREVFTGRRIDGLSAEETDRARCAGYEPDGEYLVGRDPRTVTQDELRAMGHEPMSPMQAIRAKCLDCCAGSSDEVRKCVAMICPSWPFRTGKNPWREISEGRRKAGRKLAAIRAGRSSEPKLDLGGGAEAPAEVLEAVGGGTGAEIEVNARLQTAPAFRRGGGAP